MFQFRKYLLSILAIATVQTAHADAACPSDVIKPFVGSWQGMALLVPVQGAPQPLKNRDEFAVIDCQSFEITVHYQDSTGKVARIIALKASADKSEQAGLFAINGTITEGSAVSPMTGTIKQIQDGTLLGSFFGSAGGQPAYLNELLNVTALPNGETQLVRTIQMFSGKRGGRYIGSRVVSDRRVSSR